MPSVYDIKPGFQALLRPAVKKLADWGVTPNQVTLAALILSIATGALVVWQPDRTWLWLFIPGVLLVRMALNAIDGMLAREHGMKSALGGLLNELGDVLADAALYLPFGIVQGINAWLIMGVVLLGVITEVAGLAAVQIGASRRYDGPMGKSDRAFVFGVIGLLLGLGIRPEPWLSFILIGMVVFLIWTIVNRCRKALQEVSQ